MKVHNVVYLTIIIYFAVIAYNNVYASDPCEPSDIVEFEVDVFYDIVPKRTSLLENLFGSGRANSSKMKLTVNLPQTIENRQKITKLEFEPLPSRVFVENNHKYAEYIMSIPKEKTRLQIHIEAQAFRYSLAIATNEPDKRIFDGPNLDIYLLHERMIEKDDPTIQDIAKRLQGQTELDIVKNIYKYIISNLSVDLSKLKGIGAAKTAKTKKGMCIDYCDLFVALCRAKDIPARVAAGYKPDFYANPKHSWVEVYFKEYGWVPFNPAIPNNVPEEVLDELFYNFMSPNLRFTLLRNDSLLHNNYFYCYPYWDKNFRKNIERVTETIEFKKPLPRQHDSKKDMERARKFGHIK
jgi:hypothetical protein